MDLESPSLRRVEQRAAAFRASELSSDRAARNQAIRAAVLEGQHAIDEVAAVAGIGQEEVVQVVTARA